MGLRQILEVTCPICGNIDREVPFAPTCGFVEWTCDRCAHKINLCDYTGIQYDDATSRADVEEAVDELLRKHDENT